MSERRVTVEEYHRMAETGVLSPAERVELFRGVIREKSPKSRAHVLAVNRICDLLRDKLKGRARVYKEDPLRVEALDSEPEPDVMVCANPDLAAFGTELMSPLMAIEVAEASLPFDFNDKATLYAEAGVPEYWVVNLGDRVLEVFRDPGVGCYRRHFTLEPFARTAPTGWPDLDLDVSSLFPVEESDRPGRNQLE